MMKGMLEFSAEKALVKVIKKDAPAPAPVVGGDEETALRPADLLIQEVGNGDSPDMAVQDEGALQMAVRGDIEMGSCPSNLQVQKGKSSTTSTKIKLHNDLKLAVVVITISMVTLINILFLRGVTNPFSMNLKLKLSAFFSFTTFVSAICLIFHTMKLMTINPVRLILNSQLKASAVLITISAASLFLTCLSITYSLLPKAYYFLPIVLLPSLLVAGFHFLYRAETDHRETRPEEGKTLKKALKSATQLTLSLVTTAFSGFIGDLLGIHHKEARLGGQYSYVKASVYLMLGAGLAGILALLLCRLLSSSDGHRRSGLWQRAILATANIVMLSMLVPALLMIAATILHGLLVAAVFPVIAGATAWLFLEFCTAAGADDGCIDDWKTEQGTMYAIAVAVASVSFGAILAIFSGLLGGSVGKEQLKVCTFFLASAFVAAVNLGLVTFGAPVKKASVAFAAMVLACCGLGTLVLAALAFFYQTACD